MAAHQKTTTSMMVSVTLHASFCVRITSLQVATTCDLQTVLKMRCSYCLEVDLQFSLILLLVGTCVEQCKCVKALGGSSSVTVTGHQMIPLWLADN